MQQDAELSQIIGEIYDAVLDRASWPALIGRIAAFCGAQASCVIASDLAGQTCTVSYSSGFDTQPCGARIRKYIRSLPAQLMLSAARIGDVVHLCDLLGPERFARARFGQHRRATTGWSDVLLVPIGLRGQTVTIIALARRDRLDPGERDPIHLIAPHLVQALALSGPLMGRDTQVASFEATLDRFKPGIFLLSRKGAVVQANQSGEAMQRAGKILHIAGGELRLRDMAADQVIRGAIAAAGAGQGGFWSDRPAVTTPMILPTGERYVARLLPLQDSSKKRDRTGLTAELALFVTPAELDTASPLRLIAETYKLTAAEMRVFLAVVQIGGVPEAAEDLGIARNTTRVLLQRVYKKTGINRQAGLANLLARFSTPLVH